MTTHVFIVDKTTFKFHLRYLFAGTGAKDKDVDFNSSPSSSLYSGRLHAAEAGLVAMMADCCRVRKNDYILFYLQATSKQEGKFYGVFQAVDDAFLDRKDENQYLSDDLQKNLTFRVRIKPYEVYSNGVTEWKALDEIKNIQSPCQMLWSLIYRKLKGNRGNTMITIYESERLIDLIRKENNRIHLSNVQGYDYANGQIVISQSAVQYTGRQTTIDILPRLITKYNAAKAHEVHLQMYIAQQVGRNDNLDDALGITPKHIEWIGNEVSCGVGMQRIDIMLSTIESDSERSIIPIELKAVPASTDNVRQINRYIDWIEQYYVPNRISTIRPVLICRGDGLTPALRQKFHDFNSAASGRYLPLRYVEYKVENNKITFNNVAY
jgi:predicted RNA-binding protein